MARMGGSMPRPGPEAGRCSLTDTATRSGRRPRLASSPSCTRSPSGWISDEILRGLMPTRGRPVFSHSAPIRIGDDRDGPHVVAAAVRLYRLLPHCLSDLHTRPTAVARLSGSLSASPPANRSIASCSTFDCASSPSRAVPEILSLAVRCNLCRDCSFATLSQGDVPVLAVVIPRSTNNPRALV